MNAKQSYDLVVIGSGPGGYVAAVRAVQLGMRVVCIEKEARLGGVCLNVGCIPSKALLDSSEYFHLAREHFAGHGIKIDRVGLDLKTMMARKESVVEDLTGQVKTLLTGNGITVIHGTAVLAGGGKVLVQTVRGNSKKPTEEVVTAKHILLATGSAPVNVPGLPFDGDRIVTSTEALAFQAVPKKLGIVGGGYIGLELGSVWNRLGSDVTVIEMLPKIAAGLDGQVNRSLERLLKAQGMTILTNTRVVSAKSTKTRVNVVVDNGGGDVKMTFDKVLVSVGRRPLTQHLGLDIAGVDCDDRTGQIKIDAMYQTSASGIYAIGDLVAGPMLAHKASAEGIAAVEGMAGLPGEVNYDAIPSVVYTWPEVASVGLTEEQVKERGVPYCVGTYPFSGTGRARCMGEKDGFVKIIAQSKTDRVLGIHIIGPRAADMIAEGVLAMEFNAGSEDIARTIHGHPTFSEALQEAALGIRKCSIYSS
jgi:dihydrolipoamide dehydrogenase